MSISRGPAENAVFDIKTIVLIKTMVCNQTVGNVLPLYLANLISPNKLIVNLGKNGY